MLRFATYVILVSLLCSAQTEAQSLLANGDFGSAKDAEPELWFQACVPVDGLRMWLDADKKELGLSAAIHNTHKYPRPTSNNWAQQIKNFKPGQKVQLRCKIRTESAENVVACVQCFSENEAMVAFASTPQITATQDWKEYESQAIVIPKETKHLYVRAALTGTGSVWFDDVSLNLLADAEPTTAPPAASVPAKDLKSLVNGKIVQSIELEKDCMVLSYLADWAHGNVDNIAVANNDGGVRTLLQWKPIDKDSIQNRRVVLALYARQTTQLGSASKILMQPIATDWPELSSWSKQPKLADEQLEFAFEDQKGWKTFDITELFKRSKLEHGVALRFESENVASNGWSGYAFVSREGIAEWAEFHPQLLIVE